MFDPTIFIVAVAYAAVIIALAKLGSGPTDSLVSLFSGPNELARAHGVREQDAPRFVFRDATSAAAA
jgi:hypothetical protein